MQLNGVLAAPGFESLARGRAARSPDAVLHAGRPAARVGVLDRPSRRRRADVLRVAADEPDGRAGCAGRPARPACARILYMDEILGYFPPVANPPSKPPLLTLLKQGRAFGAGRRAGDAESGRPRLQGPGATPAPGFSAGCRPNGTRRGCSTASKGPAAALDRAEADRLLSALKKRVFLMHNVHDAGADGVRDALDAVVPARAALARPDQDADGDRRASRAARRRRGPAAPARQTPAANRRRAAARAPGRASRHPGMVPADPRAKPVALYAPGVLGVARVSFSDRTLGVDTTTDLYYFAAGQRRCDSGGLGRGANSWRSGAGRSACHARGRGADSRRSRRRRRRPRSTPRGRSRSRRGWRRTSASSCCVTRAWASRHGRRIGARLPDPAAARSARGARRGDRGGAPEVRVEAGRAGRAAAAGGAGGRARSSSRRPTRRCRPPLSMGATLLGALFGRKAVSVGTLGRATTAARGVGRTHERGVRREARDGERREREGGGGRPRGGRSPKTSPAVTARLDQAVALERMPLAPKRGQVEVQFVALAWSADGSASRA